MVLTAEMLSRQIEADLDWRHEELAIFREILTLAPITETRRAVLFRGAWAILYAHYEGFCKHALQLLADFMRELPDCSKLSHPTFLFMHEKSIKSARALNNADAYNFFRSTIDALKLESPPKISIDTQNNLWPSTLSDILNDLDLGGYNIVDHPDNIKTLVGRRNDIAHGQKVFIRDLPYYLEYENSTRNLMYALALAIVDRAANYETPPV